MMRTGVLLAMLWGTASCGKGESAAHRDSLSQRERDSVIGASQLPGAGGVRGALRASDEATARRAQEDSTGQ
jgi:hypothetical protein